MVNILEKKIEKILRRSKRPLDQIEIAKKIKTNPFIVESILNKFHKKGMVSVEQ